MATYVSYKQKLLDPRWQKKRLEALESSGWACQCCHDKTSTLHVHHKQYFKGREPWEYELDLLEVLCEACHLSSHQELEALKRVLAEYPSSMAKRIFSLLVGYGAEDGYVSYEHFLVAEDGAAQAGILAWMVGGNLKSGEILEVRDAFSQLGPERFMTGIRDLVRRDTGYESGDA